MTPYQSYISCSLVYEVIGSENLNMIAFHYEQERFAVWPVLNAQPGFSHLKELCQWVILNEMPRVRGVRCRAASGATTHFRLANVKGCGLIVDAHDALMPL